MKRRIKEETVIIISVLKWLCLAALTGVVVGVSTTVFVKTLNWGSQYQSGVGYHLLLIPVGLLISTLIVKYLAPSAEGPGPTR
jgi:H+/Cl- antiporter ClcA